MGQTKLARSEIALSPTNQVLVGQTELARSEIALSAADWKQPNRRI